MEDREKELYQEKIVIGELAKEFLRKPLADHLINRAHADVEVALSGFIDLDPHDTKAVTDLQVKIKTALGVLQWLNEAITEGARALDEYIQRKEIEKEKPQQEDIL